MLNGKRQEARSDCLIAEEARKKLQKKVTTLSEVSIGVNDTIYCSLKLSPITK